MIVIPMAGLSSRFRKEGYSLPKYMLEAHGKPLFQHSVNSFKRYFSQEEFLFIALDVLDSRDFIAKQVGEMGIKNYQVVVLDQSTQGQAETVYLGIKKANVSAHEDLLIFNIDTFRPGFRWPNEFDVESVHGYLETFIGSGANWSNVLPLDEENQTAKLTAEKQEISQYCCTGLYYWRFCGDFCRIFERYRDMGVNKAQAGEYYIAPMYNDLIDEGADVRYSIIDKEDVVFCGTPREYEEYISSFSGR